jgi:short-subunit dehydrogenase
MACHISIPGKSALSRVKTGIPFMRGKRYYSASKFAVEGISDSLRPEVKPFGIDVIVIEPGGVKTEWSDIAMEYHSDQPEEGNKVDEEGQPNHLA